jgi:hypothetical protein
MIQSNESHSSITDQLRGVFAVPPLARRNDRLVQLTWQNDLIVKHIHREISRLGRGRFSITSRSSSSTSVVEWYFKRSLVDSSVGPSFGRATMEGAAVTKTGFNGAMMLPALIHGTLQDWNVAIGNLFRDGCKLIVYLRMDQFWLR